MRDLGVSLKGPLMAAAAAPLAAVAVALAVAAPALGPVVSGEVWYLLLL